MKIKDNDHYGLYFGDPRYEKVWEQMKLLGIQDITTMRQHKNGTIIWKLPIKNTWPQKGYKLYPKYIEVGSFASGMVRNNNSGYSNYQLNKCKADARYYPEYKTVNGTYKKTGKYNKYIGKQRILIPIEIDRLEYLISYCLKNYYIKHANFVPDGEYIPKWRYDNLADAAKLDYEKRDCNEVQTLKENLDDAVGTIMKHETYYVKLEDKVRDLENKLATIQRIADHG